MLVPVQNDTIGTHEKTHMLKEALPNYRLYLQGKFTESRLLIDKLGPMLEKALRAKSTLQLCSGTWATCPAGSSGLNPRATERVGKIRARDGASGYQTWEHQGKINRRLPIPVQRF